MREGFRGRLIATRANARVVLIGGLRPRAILYVDDKKRDRRPLHALVRDGPHRLALGQRAPALRLDAWVRETTESPTAAELGESSTSEN